MLEYVISLLYASSKINHSTIQPFFFYNSLQSYNIYTASAKPVLAATSVGAVTYAGSAKCGNVYELYSLQIPYTWKQPNDFLRHLKQTRSLNLGLKWNLESTALFFYLLILVNSYDIQVPAQRLATFEARFVLTNFRQLILR